MISLESIRRYQGAALNRGDSFLYLAPHQALQPYIANYTVTFPTPSTMPDDYTILPTASSTLILSVNDNNISGGIRGVNTQPCQVGASANQLELLLLIEFHPGSLYPFLRMDQTELVDTYNSLVDMDKGLSELLEYALVKSESIKKLTEELDVIFLTRLMNSRSGTGISPMLQAIYKRHGNINSHELSGEFHYSDKQIRRMFLQQVGTSPKMFSRIVRANYSLRLMQNPPSPLTDIAMQAGYFDQPHFIHDFKLVCGLSPQEYRKKMSVFYNDRFKM